MMRVPRPRLRIDRHSPSTFRTAFLLTREFGHRTLPMRGPVTDNCGHHRILWKPLVVVALRIHRPIGNPLYLARGAVFASFKTMTNCGTVGAKP